LETASGARQSLGRALTAQEAELARSLEQFFASAGHSIDALVEFLQQRGVPRPSGRSGAWTVQVLDEELSGINASLDAAYAASGGTAAQ